MASERRGSLARRAERLVLQIVLSVALLILAAATFAAPPGEPRMRVLLVTGITLVIVVPLAGWGWRRALMAVVGPVDELLSALERMGAGDTVSVPHRAREDRIGLLARAIDTLTHAAAERIAAQADEREELRVAAEQALAELDAAHERHALLSAIVDRSPTIVFLAESDGPGKWKLVFVSEGIRRLGYDPQALMDGEVSYEAAIVEADREARAEQLKAHLRAGDHEFALEYRVRTADGEVRWVHDQRIVGRDAEGAVQRLEGLISDVTERKQLELELEQLATTDGLTGMLNRRAFTREVVQEIERARRYSRPLALLMLDVDHFKSVNDRFGHAIGDATLTVFADTAREGLRRLDVLGRVGGEEFAVAMPETDSATAAMVAERLRVAVAAREVETPQGPLHVTVSVGVASWRGDDEDLDALMKRADDALYAAKDQGRDRVVVASA